MKIKFRNVAQKAQTLLKGKSATESADALNEGTQRFAQTRFGRFIQHWARREQKKTTLQQRFSLLTLISLGLFAFMLLLSLLSHSSAFAAPTQKTQVKSVASHTTVKSVASHTTVKSVASHTQVKGVANYTLAKSVEDATVRSSNPLTCTDGSAATNGLCDPSTFNPDICSSQNLTQTPTKDTCNPWGIASTKIDPTKAAIWESLVLVDQECVFESSPPNSDIQSRQVIQDRSSGDGQGYGGTVAVCVDANSGFFPCSNDEATIATDWLSGDTLAASNLDANGNLPTGADTTYTLPAHLQMTYNEDTVSQSYVSQLYPYTLGLGFLLLGPSVILAGYQMLFSASSFRYAEALTIISRLILAGAAVAACFSLIQILIGFSNTVSSAVVDLHSTIPYPAETPVTASDGSVGYYIGYSLAIAPPPPPADPNATTSPDPAAQTVADGTVLAKEPSTSYRGIVVPINRWGCAGNDFVSIVKESFWTNVFASFLPFFGSFISLAEKITAAIAVVHHLGQFAEAILSIGLAAQIVFRIIMLNFYILMGPLACGCWGLPGGTGQNIIGQWFRGFCSLLFVQAVQLFVLTVAPLVIPNMSVIGLPIDDTGLLASLFSQLPVLVVLFVTLQVPKVMGTSAAKALSTAGTMASGTVAAAGAAAYSLAG